MFSNYMALSLGIMNEYNSYSNCLHRCTSCKNSSNFNCVTSCLCLHCECCKWTDVIFRVLVQMESLTMLEYSDLFGMLTAYFNSHCHPRVVLNDEK